MDVLLVLGLSNNLQLYICVCVCVYFSLHLSGLLVLLAFPVCCSLPLLACTLHPSKDLENFC